MPLCPSCKAHFDPQSNLERAADELLPSNLELYDFGGGNTIAPIPDLTGSKYLTSHMAAIIESPWRGPETKLLPFEIKNASWQKGGDFSEEIREDLKRALALWEQKAAPELSLKNLV